MGWPFYFDNDRIAEMFNTICSTLISATLIFIFIYFNRKKPLFKVLNTRIQVGRVGAYQLSADPAYYQCSIIFDILNDSIYTAYNLKIISIHPVFPSDTEFTKDAINLESNKLKNVVLSFPIVVPKNEVMKNQPESDALERAFIQELTKKYRLPFYIHLSYRNADNRNIKKTLQIDY